VARKRYSDDGQEATPEQAKPDRRRRPRLILALKDDGTPDLSSARPEQIEALKSALEEAAPAPPEPISPVVVHMALGAVANIEAAVLAGRFGLTTEQAAQALQPAPPLREQIAEAGARVLNKYSGALGRWQDEIVLAALLVAWQSSALATLRAMATEQRAPQEQRPAAPAPGPTPAQAPPPAQEAGVLTEPLPDFADVD
jgi:hypothetical protein